MLLLQQPLLFFLHFLGCWEEAKELDEVWALVLQEVKPKQACDKEASALESTISCSSAWRGKGGNGAEEDLGKDCKGNCWCCSWEGPPPLTCLDSNCDGSTAE